MSFFDIDSGTNPGLELILDLGSCSSRSLVLFGCSVLCYFLELLIAIGFIDNALIRWICLLASIFLTTRWELNKAWAGSAQNRVSSSSFRWSLLGLHLDRLIRIVSSSQVSNSPVRVKLLFIIPSPILLVSFKIAGAISLMCLYLAFAVFDIVVVCTAGVLGRGAA